MSNKIDQDVTKILITMFQESKDMPEGEETWFGGDILSELTGLTPNELNDAVNFLGDRGLIERTNTIGTQPYRFHIIKLNSRGRYVYHDMMSAQEKEKVVKPQLSYLAPSNAIANTPPLPVGSPFGFTYLDWEYVQKKRRHRTNLFVVMGFQFESVHYDTEKLKTNIKASFQKTVDSYNQRGGRENILLEFKPLAAGYGEHLFNQIARDIIAADIAVFETSDINPNVMIEMGVALTWGSRVLPIRKVGLPKPPSDISGQTWADYAEDGAVFTKQNHDEELVAMIEKAIQKKSI